MANLNNIMLSIRANHGGIATVCFLLQKGQKKAKPKMLRNMYVLEKHKSKEMLTNFLLREVKKVTGHALLNWVIGNGVHLYYSLNCTHILYSVFLYASYISQFKNNKENEASRFR